MYRETKLNDYYERKKKPTARNLENTTKPKEKGIYLNTTKETLTKDEIEKKLLEFDLNSKYGPSYGITRYERFERAQKFGLDPPKEITDLINMSENKPFWEKYYC